jgi:hypothetical protein
VIAGRRPLLEEVGDLVPSRPEVRDERWPDDDDNEDKNDKVTR